MEEIKTEKEFTDQITRCIKYMYAKKQSDKVTLDFVNGLEVEVKLKITIKEQ